MKRKSMKITTKIPMLSSLSRVQRILLIIACGAFCGCGALFFYLLRAHTYLGDDSSACINCHVMSPYYATWMHSSHSRNATCNDCHVPHENVARKYAFKAMDGMKHTAMFLTKSEAMSPKAGSSAESVIMDNCIRCHTELTTELAMGTNTDMRKAVDGGKKCWDCHRDVPHGGTNSLASAPDAIVPIPKTTVPEWIQRMSK